MLLVAGLVAVFSGASRAQPVEPSTVAPHSQARLDGEANHLARVGVWGGANLVGGLLAGTMAESDPVQAFGLQSAAWGAVNLGIAGVLLSRGEQMPESTYAAERAAERRYQRYLQINLVLDGGYLLAGGLTSLTAPSGPGGGIQRGHGAALVTQGAALLLLDGMAYHASRRRSAALAQVRVLPAPGGAQVTVRL